MKQRNKAESLTEIDPWHPKRRAETLSSELQELPELGSAVLFPSLKFTIVSFISTEKFIKMILGLLVRPFIGRVLNKPRQWYGLCVHPPLVGRYRFYVHMEVFVHCWYQSLAFWTCPVEVSLCHPWSTCKELLLTKLLLVI